MDTNEALAIIRKERERQLGHEGFKRETEDRMVNGELATAAGCYAQAHIDREKGSMYPQRWPWPVSWWNPTEESRARELIVAGALIVAELERLGRAGLVDEGDRVELPKTLMGLPIEIVADGSVRPGEMALVSGNGKDIVFVKASPENEKLHLDVDLEKARALHRVWRALNDGDCPRCHTFHGADAIRRTAFKIQCPSCDFSIFKTEITQIQKMFAPAMDKCVAIFEAWRDE